MDGVWSKEGKMFSVIMLVAIAMAASLAAGILIDPTPPRHHERW